MGISFHFFVKIEVLSDSCFFNPGYGLYERMILLIQMDMSVLKQLRRNKIQCKQLQSNAHYSCTCRNST